jgi:hypothetical protein
VLVRFSLYPKGNPVLYVFVLCVFCRLEPGKDYDIDVQAGKQMYSVGDEAPTRWASSSSGSRGPDMHSTWPTSSCCLHANSCILGRHKDKMQHTSSTHAPW